MKKLAVLPAACCSPGASRLSHEAAEALAARFRSLADPTRVAIVNRLAGVERPRLVVDLGSGTGLSTNVWSDRADEVVGIEPNPDMRAQAVAAPGVTFLDATAQDTGLSDACADIVTASQSLHWMEPEP